MKKKEQLLIHKKAFVRKGSFVDNSYVVDYARPICRGETSTIVRCVHKTTQQSRAVRLVLKKNVAHKEGFLKEINKLMELVR